MCKSGTREKKPIALESRRPRPPLGVAGSPNYLRGKVEDVEQVWELTAAAHPLGGLGIRRVTNTGNTVIYSSHSKILQMTRKSRLKHIQRPKKYQNIGVVVDLFVAF